MALYQRYSLLRIFRRRLGAVLLGIICSPVMIFRSDRSRFYSYLHLLWIKTSDKPVWLKHADAVSKNFPP